MPDIRNLEGPGTHTGATSPEQQSPVFVLSASRSGSTLVRFILDSHPDLACPPETGVTAACAGLVHAWDILENADVGDRTDTEAAGLAGSPRALAAVRDTVDGIYGRYLERRGKRRWCDKSLGSHQGAELMAQVYPEAKFICLYRHCMDVVASGAEACPWGLHRYGFDGFAAQYPGNSVEAIGSYWLAAVQSIMAFEERHPAACHRIRYEDLVTAPEETVAAMFSFLGAEPVPGITRACFRTAHEGNGPGDEEIWFTDGIAVDWVGCGVSVPVAALTPESRQGINEALVRLGYRPVDEGWNAQVGHVDVRADTPGHAPVAQGDLLRQHGEPETVAHVIGDRLGSLADHEVTEALAIWPAVAGQTIAIVVEGDGGEHAGLRWRFAARPESGEDGTSDRTDQPVCTMIASPGTWCALLLGEANIVGEMTAGRLRCINRRDGHRVRSDEVHAISWLLGLARVPLLREPDIQVPELAARDA
jgi:sulfotransferase family protein